MHPQPERSVSDAAPALAILPPAARRAAGMAPLPGSAMRPDYYAVRRTILMHYRRPGDAPAKNRAHRHR